MKRVIVALCLLTAVIFAAANNDTVRNAIIPPVVPVVVQTSK